MNKIFLQTAERDSQIEIEPDVLYAIIKAARNTMLKRRNDELDMNAAVAMSEMERRLLGVRYGT